ncbi:alpha-xenorhabdolysin family binary toxin subunit B [Pseudomonas sp. AK106]
MNILRFNTDVNAVSPDMGVVNVCIQQMLDLTAVANFSFDQTRYLPSIHVKAAGLYGSLTQARRALDEAALKMEVSASQGLKKLNALRGAITETASDDDLEDNAYFRAHAISILKRGINAAEKDAQQRFKSLSDVAFNPALTGKYKSELDAELAQLNLAQIASEEKIEALEVSRKVLSDAMAVLEKRNFADIAKDTVLSVENISAVGMAAPEAELIRLAVEHMKKTLEDISKALNYLTMYDQRERLIKQIEALKPGHDQRAADLKMTAAKITLIDSVHALYQSFFNARAEYAKFNQGITAFFDHLKLGDQAGYEDRFVSIAPSLIDYLKTIR